MDLCIQKLADAVQGSLAAGSFLNEHGNRHDRPHDRREISDVLHQLAGIEFSLVDQITSITQDHTDHRFHKKSDQDIQKCGDPGIGHVGVLVFLVEFSEGIELLVLFYERFDDSDTGIALLCKIRKIRKSLLALFPFLYHDFSESRSDTQKEGHWDQGKNGQQMIHIPHLKDGQKPQQQRIKKHQDTIAEALLDRIQIVGIKTHKISYFIDLIVFL